MEPSSKNIEMAVTKEGTATMSDEDVDALIKKVEEEKEAAEKEKKEKARRQAEEAPRGGGGKLTRGKARVFIANLLQKMLAHLMS